MTDYKINPNNYSHIKEEDPFHPSNSEITIKYNKITNEYNFKENKELSKSTKIAFAARVEGRKNLEYLDNLESLIFTNSETFEKYYKKKFGYTFLKSKIYKFNYKNKNKFYEMNWGVSHSCFENEPFGYGIFEAIDWGKLPIIHRDWCEGLDYKYKANRHIHLQPHHQL
jgi:hypothetical protein